MYFGDIEYNGANHVVYELVANAVDLFLAKLSTIVRVNVAGSVISVFDDGPGMPFWEKYSEDDSVNLVQRYLTHRHDSPTADGHAPHIHLLGGGLGLAVVNAASGWMKITSSDGESLWTQEFGKGNVESELLVENTTRPRGTTVELKLDKDLFGNNSVNMFELRKTLFELAHFYPGLIVELQKERFYSENGLLDLAYILHQRDASIRYGKKFHFSGKKHQVQIHVAALGDSDKQTEFHSWVNGGETVKGGTHVEGIKQAFAKIGWVPKTALIHVIMHDPLYAGPCKDALRNKEVLQIIEEILASPIETFNGEIE